MAKPKDLKRREAVWRSTRAELLRHFLNDTDSELQAQRLANGGRGYESQDAEAKIAKREAVLAEYLAIPWSWRKTALEGHYLGEDLPGKLDKAQARERAQDLESALMRAHERITPKPRF